MLPRVLRVTRAKAVQKTALASKHTRPSSRLSVNGSSNPNRGRTYNPKASEQELSLQGRAAKLLGKAGAAHFRRGEEPNHERRPKKGFEDIARSPKSIVFEGFRASSKFGKPKDLKLGKGGKKGKPKNRSAKRATEWRKSGGKGTK
jgi:nucleolar protein 12